MWTYMTQSLVRDPKKKKGGIYLLEMQEDYLKCHNKKPSQRVPFTTKLCVKMMVKNMGTVS